MPTFFQPSTIANLDMTHLLSGNIYEPMITGYDPFWLHNTENSGVLDGTFGAPMFEPGFPNVNVWDYCAMGPQPANNVGKTHGHGRATGVMVDGAGKVGMFLNGFDTPSEQEFDGSYRGYGPAIHLQKLQWGPAIFSATNPNQCLHMACTVQFGKTWFGAQAGVNAGVGGQLGWRCTLRRIDRLPFKQGLDELVVLLGFWDSRHVGDPGHDGNDSSGNVTAGEHWCSGTLAPGKTSRYVTNYGAVLQQGVRPEGETHQFYWNIERHNMLNILADFGVPNVAPEDVSITSTSFNCEMYDNRPAAQREKFKPGQFGFNFSNTIVDIW